MDSTDIIQPLDFYTMVSCMSLKTMVSLCVDLQEAQEHLNYDYERAADKAITLIIRNGCSVCHERYFFAMIKAERERRGK